MGKAGYPEPSEWVTLNERLQIRRDELNAYVDAVHRTGTNGLTPYSAMGIALKERDTHAPALCWPSKDTHDAKSYSELELLAGRLGMTFAAVKVRPVLNLVHVEDWSGAWQERLIAGARTLGRAAAAVKAALTRLSPRFGIAGVGDTTVEGLEHFADLARDLVSTSGSDYTIILHKDFVQLRQAISQLETAISSYRGIEGRLSVPYTPSEIARIPVEDIDRDWRQANAAMWPKSWFGVRRVKRMLGSYANVKTTDPTNDLPLIRTLQNVYRGISQNTLASTPLAFEGLNTDCENLKIHLRMAERLDRQSCA